MPIQVNQGPSTGYNIVSAFGTILDALRQSRKEGEDQQLRMLELLKAQPGIQITPTSAEDMAGATGSGFMQRLFGGAPGRTATGEQLFQVGGVPVTARQQPLLDTGATDLLKALQGGGAAQPTNMEPAQRPQLPYAMPEVQAPLQPAGGTTPGTAPAPPTSPQASKSITPSAYDALIVAKAAKYGVNPNYLRALITPESGGDPSAVSPKGAGGLFQVMPGTAAPYLEKLQVTDPAAILDPEINTEVAAMHLADLQKTFPNNPAQVFAAYHQGIGNVRAAMDKGQPYNAALSDATATSKGITTGQYVSMMMRRFAQLQQGAPSQAASALPAAQVTAQREPSLPKDVTFTTSPAVPVADAVTAAATQPSPIVLAPTPAETGGITSTPLPLTAQAQAPGTGTYAYPGGRQAQVAGQQAAKQGTPYVTIPGYGEILRTDAQRIAEHLSSFSRGPLRFATPQNAEILRKEKETLYSDAQKRAQEFRAAQLKARQEYPELDAAIKQADSFEKLSQIQMQGLTPPERVTQTRQAATEAMRLAGPEGVKQVLTQASGWSLPKGAIDQLEKEFNLPERSAGETEAAKEAAKGAAGGRLDKDQSLIAYDMLNELRKTKPAATIQDVMAQPGILDTINGRLRAQESLNEQAKRQAEIESGSTILSSPSKRDAATVVYQEAIQGGTIPKDMSFAQFIKMPKVLDAINARESFSEAQRHRENTAIQKELTEDAPISDPASMARYVNPTTGEVLSTPGYSPSQLAKAGYVPVSGSDKTTISKVFASRGVVEKLKLLALGGVDTEGIVGNKGETHVGIFQAMDKNRLSGTIGSRLARLRQDPALGKDIALYEAWKNSLGATLIARGVGGDAGAFSEPDREFIMQIFPDAGTHGAKLKDTLPLAVASFKAIDTFLGQRLAMAIGKNADLANVSRANPSATRLTPPAWSPGGSPPPSANPPAQQGAVPPPSASSPAPPAQQQTTQPSINPAAIIAHAMQHQPEKFVPQPGAGPRYVDVSVEGGAPWRITVGEEGMPVSAAPVSPAAASPQTQVPAQQSPPQQVPAAPSPQGAPAGAPPATPADVDAKIQQLGAAPIIDWLRKNRPAAFVRDASGNITPTDLAVPSQNATFRVYVQNGNVVDVEKLPLNGTPPPAPGSPEAYRQKVGGKR